MLPYSWRRWGKLTKKQLRQLGRTIDEEISNVLGRKSLHPNDGRLVKVPVPIPVRQTPPKFHLSGTKISTRGYHQSADGPIHSRWAQRGSGFITAPTSRVTMFSTAPRAPRGVPRGLFTNWNMCARNSGQRMYSTASIKFTHEAINNIAISLRCFFNSLDELALPINDDQLSGMLWKSAQSQSKLSPRDVSLIHDAELFEMIQYHKSGVFMTQEDEEDALGAYVEFKVPQFDMRESIPQKAFASSVTLDKWKDGISIYTDNLKALECSVRRIYENYGSLPITTNKDSIRIHFPTLTILETEKLMIELGIVTGNIFPDPNGPQSDILSTPDVSDSNSDLDFSSVLSPASSISVEPFVLA